MAFPSIPFTVLLFLWIIFILFLFLFLSCMRGLSFMLSLFAKLIKLFCFFYAECFVSINCKKKNICTIHINGYVIICVNFFLYKMSRKKVSQKMSRMPHKISRNFFLYLLISSYISEAAYKILKDNPLIPFTYPPSVIHFSWVLT